MLPKALLVASLAGIVVTAATGLALVDSGPDPTPRSTPSDAKPAPVAPILPSFNLTWKGHYKLGVADCAMLACPAHTYETEPVVEPVAKAGVRIDIPANTSLLEFELRWTGTEKLHLMVHGPMEADHSMPSYMAMGGALGRLCLAIAPAEIVSGMWEVMAHAGSMGYQDTSFTIHVNGDAPTGAKIRTGPHGHPVAEDWSMDMKETKSCRTKSA